ncbi:Ribosomal protein S18 acetylase RimI [Natronoarchaeum philippinense]|uniref:Ribosomal protein S18 acetylase RimI n=1 Tax=Natronoarchaeum philippinense TaxID=558529 RepID=A0A285P6C7_NATPI|nr:GNAT family N-acetyltransferase [Natronoarchaeum philippinense]SNZ17309.1 Ribosomal protein S18 acetylase RimI [Natronoarchaeum philippinense]
MTDGDLTVREATAEDYEDVVAFTEDTWPERETGDYLADVFHDWLAAEDAKTAVAVDDETAVGILQCTLLSDREAWLQGMRVAPDHRGRGVGSLLVEHLFDWAREQGATVARNMVFSWNQAGLGQSRATGFEPTTEFRWLEPDPDPDAEGPLDTTNDPDIAWQCWQESAARDHLRGLALAPEESWALRELTLADLRDAADEGVIAVTSEDGARAMTVRVRDYERETESGDSERVAEYGVAAWADLPAAESLVAAIKRDAAALGADRTRVLLPETVRHVSDGAALRAGISDTPDFVLAADLSGR